MYSHKSVGVLSLIIGQSLRPHFPPHMESKLLFAKHIALLSEAVSVTEPVNIISYNIKNPACIQPASSLLPRTTVLQIQSSASSLLARTTFLQAKSSAASLLPRTTVLQAQSSASSLDPACFLGQPTGPIFCIQPASKDNRSTVPIFCIQPSSLAL